MENQPPNDGGQSRMPPAKPPDRKSDRKDKASAESSDESSEEETETPMFQALEEQPAAIATKNGVSQPWLCQ